MDLKAYNERIFARRTVIGELGRTSSNESFPSQSVRDAARAQLREKLRELTRISQNVEGGYR